MKKITLSIIVATTAFAFANASHAEGCAKGAAVGGVTGHVAGKHGVAGATAGCAIGHHEAKKKQKAASDAEAKGSAPQ
ncbi:hypothetical protein ACFQ3P_00540 [Paraburkholderia sabiae]|jgi:hypothetical protein|uniref:Glycine zipper 2TM domain-containing protein n=1 Tax=Paraburkholderia sabiae TaxID=273251 RepID=A0ABU9Q8R0_9BURK|nr:hypothetical protein [Paraburkholderia sabiae]WJZ78375.1 hypothetical protein QEN71_30750 [Paraburkholderia sabiae]CAD6507839.1 hypothetical protein LMG24235_00107 [Paraburkholderia sabiae]